MGEGGEGGAAHGRHGQRYGRGAMSWFFMVIVVGSAAAASCVWWPHRVGDGQTKDSPDHLNRVKNGIHVEDVETVLGKDHCSRCTRRKDQRPKLEDGLIFY